MERTTQWLAQRIGARCEGDPDRVITDLASLRDALGNHLAFCVGGRHLAALSVTRAGAVVLHDGVALPNGVVALRHPDPRLAIARLAAEFTDRPRPVPGVHGTAWVAPDSVVEGATIDAMAVVESGAVVGSGTWVMPQSYIGRGARVGAECRIGPHAVVMDGAVLGRGVVLQPGAVVGAAGFGFARDARGWVSMPAKSSVVVADDVMVGANSVIDRGSLTDTWIGEGVRLDNLVHVAHGASVGARTLVAALSGIAGSAQVGVDVLMGGRSAVVDGIEVGAGARLAAGASATRKVDPGEAVAGTPAVPLAEWRRQIAHVRDLPALSRRVDELRRRLEEIFDGLR